MMQKLKHNLHKKPVMIGVIVVIVTLCCIPIVNISFSSQAADVILRPLIGEKNTLALESMYFGLQDKFDATRYLLLGQHPPTFLNASVVNTKKELISSPMSLSSLPVLSSLVALPYEGVWVPLSQSLSPGRVIIAQTFIRPDQTRPYAVVDLVKMDMRILGMGAQAGTFYPGGTHKMYGPGIVPKSLQQSGNLLAVFNGGFQERDGHYGMVVGNKTYVPLQKDMPALVLSQDGSIQLVSYVGQTFTQSPEAIRQNGPYVIHNGAITPYVDQSIDTWGRTTTNSMYTWRSGIGITKEGDLIYAAGNALIPTTLARALQIAGAVNAIQLDINPPWVKFIVYHSIGNGLYTFNPLVASMTGGGEYLKGNRKDFFYIYKK